MITIGTCSDNNNKIKQVILATETIPGGPLPSELEKPGFPGLAGNRTPVDNLGSGQILKIVTLYFSEWDLF